ncbi:MAG: hypothetical protein AAF417_22110 [Pseudomonadota bacterium]
MSNRRLEDLVWVNGPKLRGIRTEKFDPNMAHLMNAMDGLANLPDIDEYGDDEPKRPSITTVRNAEKTTESSKPFSQTRRRTVRIFAAALEVAPEELVFPEIEQEGEQQAYLPTALNAAYLKGDIAITQASMELAISCELRIRVLQYLPGPRKSEEFAIAMADMMAHKRQLGVTVDFNVYLVTYDADRFVHEQEANRERMAIYAKRGVATR